MGAKNNEIDVSQNGTTRKFPLAKLAANCRQLFGVSSCTFAGATHGMTGDFTVEEMKTHIENWGKKEAK